MKIILIIAALAIFVSLSTANNTQCIQLLENTQDVMFKLQSSILSDISTESSSLDAYKSILLFAEKINEVCDDVKIIMSPRHVSSSDFSCQRSLRYVVAIIDDLYTDISRIQVIQDLVNLGPSIQHACSYDLSGNEESSLQKSSLYVLKVDEMLADGREMIKAAALKVEKDAKLNFEANHEEALNYDI